VSIAPLAERNRAKKPENRPRGILPASGLTPGTLPRNTLLYKPSMAPRDFRENQRSKGPRGGRPSFGGKPHAGKPKPGGGSRPPHAGKPHAGKPKSSGESWGYAEKPRPGGNSRLPHSGKPNAGKPHSGKSHAGSKPKSGTRPPHSDKYKHPGSGNPRPAARAERPTRSENWLYGIHAVQAALANPRRKLGRLLLTHRAAEIMGEERPDHVRVEIMEMDAIGKFLPPGAVHQGAAVETGPLPVMDLESLLARPSDGRRRVVLVLDQLTDPHNVGAILRSAVAFGVIAVVVQDRHAPPQSGVLAKAASGALDLVPYVEVVNIARALDQLAAHGFWRIALAGDGAQPLGEAIPPGDVALVLGSEGDGIRRLVREHCEAAAFIPMQGAMESLNVSNAAAIALYELSRK